ncbi:hypothetical protein F8M41_016155 [Gigaspora margarita]|uniref:Uncharacterized protein n=1 Tax=Gigaspora margarita TaxID=4874 RepID=A0A8H3WX54_GIGMA|nr:hypothetical protein F8M41_016155 [Gigaspora margarita]
MMSGKKNSELRDIIKSSKTKRELILKLLRENPEYLIENLSSIKRVAELIYDKKNTFKRKRVENNILSESSNEEEKNVTTEKKKEIATKINEISEICSRRASKLKDEYSNEDIFKVIGDHWRNSSDNPKNV